jgi:hypothetical protein
MSAEPQNLPQGDRNDLSSNKSSESKSDQYARQTRNLAVFIAVIVSIMAVAAIITGIALAVHAHTVHCQTYGC